MCMTVATEGVITMGQRANSGRNASLDDKKQRMAGRIGDRTGVSRDFDSPQPGAGRTKGAFGKGGRMHDADAPPKHKKGK
jgi:hypothetical protein